MPNFIVPSNVIILFVTSFHYALINRSQCVPRKNLQTGLGSQIKKVLAGYAEAYHNGGASCPMSSGVCGCAVCLGSVLSQARFVFIEFFMVHGVAFGSALLPANHTEVIYIASCGTPGSRMKPSMTVTAADRCHRSGRHGEFRWRLSLWWRA